MESEEARTLVLHLVQEKGKATYAEIHALCENDRVLCERVCQDLISSRILAEDKKGAGLIYRSIMAIEADSHIEAAVFSVTRRTVPDFLRAYRAGEFDEDDSEIRRLVALARLWGH